MSIFKKRERLPPTDTGKFSNKVATTILHIQSRWASYMGRKTSRWTPFQKTLGLILFCAVMGAQCSLALYQAFRVSPNHKAVVELKPDHIKSILIQKDTLMDYNIRVRMKALSLAIDSMQKTDSGRVWIAALKENRPGLWDSIQISLSYYK